MGCSCTVHGKPSLKFFSPFFMSQGGRFPSLPRDFRVYRYQYTLPVLRVFLCKRCRIRTRDHCLISLEGDQYATISLLKSWTRDLAEFYQVFSFCIRLLQMWQFSSLCSSGLKMLEFFLGGKNYILVSDRNRAHGGHESGFIAEVSGFWTLFSLFNIMFIFYRT